MRKTTKAKTDRVTSDLLEVVGRLSKHGLLSVQDMADVKALCEPPPAYSAERVLEIRTTKAKMSQAVFAGFLNVSSSTVQKWEAASSGKRPSGAAAKLLQLIEKKGIEAIAV